MSIITKRHMCTSKLISSPYTSSVTIFRPSCTTQNSFTALYEKVLTRVRVRACECVCVHARVRDRLQWELKLASNNESNEISITRFKQHTQYLYRSFSVTSLLFFIYNLLQLAKCLAYITAMTVPDTCVGIDRFHEFSSQTRRREMALFSEIL